jgi:hypothetical protein
MRDEQSSQERGVIGESHQPRAPITREETVPESESATREQLRERIADYIADARQRGTMGDPDAGDELEAYDLCGECASDWPEHDARCGVGLLIGVLAFIDAEHVEPQWQPIETAPREGVILVSEGEKYPDIAWWVSAIGETQGYWSNGETDAYGDAAAPLQPTHWMPLPAAPVAQQEPTRMEGKV